MSTKKKLLQAAAGSAGGAAALNVEDVFSTYLYNGNGDTQVIENGINLGQSNSGVSIFFPDGDGDYLATASLPQFTGAFTFEFWFYSYDSARAVYLIDKGVRDTNFSIQTNYLTDDQLFVKVAGTSFSYTTAGLDADGWNHIAVVRDSSDNVATFVNGTRRGSPTTASGSVTGGVYYIGSSSAGISASGYELMYGHMSSVRISDTARYSTSSTSITVPTSEYTSDSNTVLLLGQGDTPLADASSNSYSVTVNGNPRASEVGPFTAADAGEGGLVWAKSRGTTDGHFLFDTERGATKRLRSHLTNAENTDSTSLTSFNANGFSIGNNASLNNGVGTEYASWTFRKAPKFFDVVTYTGTGSAQTIAHNLGTTVGCLIIKRTDSASSDGWIVYHDGFSKGTAPKIAFLNATDAAFQANSTYLNSTYPTDTHFSVGTFADTNASGGTYVAYLFAHNDGDGDFGSTADQDIIKCGSYTGNGSTNGPEINLGFEPQWLLIKVTSGTTDQWVIFDTMRGLVTGGADNRLFPNLSNAEGTGIDYIEVTPTGFKPTVNADLVNRNTSDYIYIAIRRGPMAVPTDATDVFDASLRTGTGSVPVSISTNFAPDMWLLPRRNSSSFGNYLETRITGFDEWLETNSTAGPALTWTSGTGPSMNNDNIEITVQDNSVNQSGGTYVDYVWKRAPNYFDVVAYTGNGTAGRTVSHNLGVAPEMMWVKARTGSGREWTVWHKDTGGNGWLRLNTTDSLITGIEFRFGNNSTYVAPTDTEFTVGSLATVNASSDPYIAYLFASLDGVSKVGSYTGNAGASTINVDCGFTNGARFVLIKETSGTGDWWVFDTARGLVAGNDPALKLNTTDAELSADFIDPYSAGFSLQTNSAINTNGATFIFYAIA